MSRRGCSLRVVLDVLCKSLEKSAVFTVSFLEEFVSRAGHMSLASKFRNSNARLFIFNI